MSAPPRKSLSSRSWRRPCLLRCPCGVPSPKHLDPRGISLLASPRARGASRPLRHSRRGPAYPQACHPGRVTKDELGCAQLQGLHPPAASTTLNRIQSPHWGVPEASALETSPAPVSPAPSFCHTWVLPTLCSHRRVSAPAVLFIYILLVVSLENPD